MPTVLRLLNWRFHFYSDEGTEPPHIHVRTPDGECKFWLGPVRLAKVEGSNSHLETWGQVRRCEEVDFYDIQQDILDICAKNFVFSLKSTALSICIMSIEFK